MWRLIYMTTVSALAEFFYHVSKNPSVLSGLPFQLCVSSAHTVSIFNSQQWILEKSREKNHLFEALLNLGSQIFLKFWDFWGYCSPAQKNLEPTSTSSKDLMSPCWTVWILRNLDLKHCEKFNSNSCPSKIFQSGDWSGYCT